MSTSGVFEPVLRTLSRSVRRVPALRDDALEVVLSADLERVCGGAVDSGRHGNGHGALRRHDVLEQRPPVRVWQAPAVLAVQGDDVEEQQRHLHLAPRFLDVASALQPHATLQAFEAGSAVRREGHDLAVENRRLDVECLVEFLPAPGTTR